MLDNALKCGSRQHAKQNDFVNASQQTPPVAYMACLTIFGLNMCFPAVCVLHAVGIKMSWVAFQIVSCCAIRLASLDKNVQLSSTTHIIFAVCTWAEGESTIIERGWAKYRNLSVASRSIMCRSRKLKKIIDLRDTDKITIFCNNWVQ